MERVAQARSATITQTFYVDGTPTDTTGTPTVALTRADGSVLLPATSTGVTHPGTGQYSYTLTPAQTALLDTLTVTWVGGIGGQNQTFTDTVEVAGGFLFSIADARAWRPLESTTLYPTSVIVGMRTLVEEAFEHACGYAFVPRYSTQTWSSSGWHEAVLPPYTSAIRSFTVDGTAQTGWTLVGAGTVTPTLSYPYGYGYTWRGSVVSVAYEHGMTTPPPRVAAAALGEARYRLIARNSPSDERAVRLDTEVGSYALQQPGRGGMQMFLPESDAVIQQYGLQAGVA